MLFLYPASKDFLYAVQAQTQMYVVRFMAKLEKDTSYKGLDDGLYAERVLIV